MPRRNGSEEPELVRFGVSMEPELLRAFDRLLERTGISCRSKAVRDMVRTRLAEAELESGPSPAVGVLSFIYSHDQPDLAERLLHLEHERHTEVVSSVHVHLDRNACLEVLIMRGRASQLRELADRLSGLRGVRHARLSLLPAACPLAHKKGAERR